MSPNLSKSTTLIPRLLLCLLIALMGEGGLAIAPGTAQTLLSSSDDHHGNSHHGSEHHSDYHSDRGEQDHSSHEDHGHYPNHENHDAHGHSSDSDPSAHGHSDGHSAHGHHSTLEIPSSQPTPTVTLQVSPDPHGGWNLQLQTTHFTFAPERVNQDSLTTEGHAHLYVNGEKVARLYGHWYHLGSLPSGIQELKVSLNANGHEALTYQGQEIADTVVIEVPEI